MTTNCEVISAFLDDEPVDGAALSDALATVEGRRFLVDAVALRRMTRSQDAVAMVPASKSTVTRFLAVAAAIIVAAVTSFQLGFRQGGTASVKAPEPTRVISAGPWQEDSPRGGVR